MAVGFQLETARVVSILNQYRSVFQMQNLLRAIGARQLKWINDNFKVGGLLGQRRWPPLSPNTRAKPRRGGSSSRPLQDTGGLRQSFTQKIVGLDTVAVGTTDQVAKWHEKGTRGPYIIRPRPGRRALKFMMATGWTIRKSVQHPGIPARPMLPDIRTAEELAKGVVNAALEQVSRRVSGQR